MTTDIKTTVVNIRKGASCDVYVGRPSKWGNPFREPQDGSREEVIAKYKMWLLQQPGLMSRLGELRGARLGCWCHPQPCHADVLAELADASHV